MLTTPLALSSTVCGNQVFHWGSRTYVMGIINLTPDSFSGDGVGDDVDAAVARALRLMPKNMTLITVGSLRRRTAW